MSGQGHGESDQSKSSIGARTSSKGRKIHEMIDAIPAGCSVHDYVLEILRKLSSGSLSEEDQKRLGEVWGELARGSLLLSLREGGATPASEILVDLDSLKGYEWTAIFRDVLGVPMGSVGAQDVANTTLHERLDRAEAGFREALPEYPYLARIWDTYEDTIYEADEINDLKAECVRVQVLAQSDQVASKGLGKLIYACDEALRHGVALELLSD
jgi:hypothetical protein